MACKHILVAFFFVNVILYTAAQKLTQSDLDQLKSAWLKADQNAVEYAKALTVPLVDEVALPIASEMLELVSFVLNEDIRNKIVNLISKFKTIVDFPEFSEFVLTAADLINKFVIPNLTAFGDIFNKPEEFLSHTIGVLMEVGLYIYQSCLKKAKPVLDAFMANDWTAEEIAAVDKVLFLLGDLNADMIKNAFATS